MCTSFKAELMQAVHNFSTSGGNTFKLALYTNSAVPTDFGGSGSIMNNTITTYNSTNEVPNSGSGANPYAAGGGTLTNVTPQGSGTVGFTDFADLTFTTATITARGAVIYNDTPAGNPAVCVLDFASDKTSTAGDFKIVFPAFTTSDAIIRIE